jgi:hypothetical protein
MPSLPVVFWLNLCKSHQALMLVLVAALLSPGLSSCGGGTSSPTPNPPPTSSVTVALSPRRSAVTTSQPQAFSATLSGGTGALLWFVDGAENGSASVGTIASTGATTATYSPGPATQPGIHSIAAKVSGGALSPAASVAVTDLTGVLTHHNDNARTGANTKEYALAHHSFRNYFRQAFFLRSGQPRICVCRAALRSQSHHERRTEAQRRFRRHGK